MKTIVPLVGLFLSIPTAFAQNYTAKNLGTLGGDYAVANAINNSGKVVGSASLTGNSATHAVLFSGSGTSNTDLGTLGGVYSVANAINDSGIIVGMAYSPSNQEAPVLFKGLNGNNYFLGGLAGATSQGGNAYAINNAGKIVGDSKAAVGYPAVAFSGTGLNNVDLGNLGNADKNGEAKAISPSGQIFGRSYNVSGNSRATRFSGTGSGNVDLGTLGGTTGFAYAVNASNQIVGASSTISGAIHATLFSNTGSNPIDLGTLGGTNSYASAINKRGWIVGQSTVVVDGILATHAFLYRNGAMVDLNSLIPATPGLVLQEGRGINDAGQIAVTAIFNGKQRAFRLDPIITYKIAAKASPASKGTVTGAKTYVSGTTVTLTAKAKKGMVFTNWTEAGKVVSKKKIYQFTAAKSRSLVAHFKKSAKAKMLFEP